MSMWSACVCALVASAAAVPVQNSREMSVVVNAASAFSDAADFAQLASALSGAPLAGLEAHVQVSMEKDSHRRLQSAKGSSAALS